jgi:uncharacterized protein (TIGR02421 family)
VVFIYFTDYILLDQKVCQLSSSLSSNILSYTFPQNFSEEKKRFFAELEKKEEYNPKFIYAPRNPLFNYFSVSPTFNVYKNELKELLSEVGRDSLGLIYERKLLDLFDRLELVRSVGTANFSTNSESYYGSIDKSALKLAEELVQKETKFKSKTISMNRAKQVINSFLKKKKLKYKITMRPHSSSSFSVNIRTKNIFINQDYVFTKESLKRLIAHEIESHIYRYENGVRQPYLIFAKGLSKETLKTEEGLAVYVEEKKKINTDLQLKNYAGRVVAINLALKKNFYDTFISLTQYFSKEDAYNLTFRAKRGIHSQEEKGAFTKDNVYLKGYLSVKEYLKDRSIEDLFYGRYAIEDAPLVFDVDGLKKPKYLPEFK